MRSESATAAGMRVLVCTPFGLDDPKGNSVAAVRLLAGFQRHGVAVRVLDDPAIHNPDRIGAVCSDFCPQVVLILHPWRCAAVSMLLRTVGAVPQVVSLRGTDINEMLDHPDTRDTLRGVLDAAAAIAVFRRSAADRLAVCSTAWRSKTVIIPNGVKLTACDVPFRSRLRISPDAFVFAAVCGLRQVKQPLRVLPWLKRLRDRHPQIVWMHAGQPLEADAASALRDFAAGHPWVYHIDHMPHSQMEAFFRAADVFVSASRSEGMPHAVREAMLTARPCLLSAIEGHCALAEAEREALFFTDEQSFTAAAGRLITQPSLRVSLGQAARSRIQKDLAESDEIELYLQLFTAVIAGRPVNDTAGQTGQPNIQPSTVQKTIDGGTGLNGIMAVKSSDSVRRIE